MIVTVNALSSLFVSYNFYSFKIIIGGSSDRNGVFRSHSRVRPRGVQRNV